MKNKIINLSKSVVGTLVNGKFQDHDIHTQMTYNFSLHSGFGIKVFGKNLSQKRLKTASDISECLVSNIDLIKDELEKADKKNDAMDIELYEWIEKTKKGKKNESTI